MSHNLKSIYDLNIVNRVGDCYNVFHINRRCIENIPVWVITTNWPVRNVRNG